MEPTLFDGDVVFIDPGAFRSHSPRDLDVVVAHHPSKPGIEIVKRVEFTTDEGAYLTSDNPDAEGASDSRRFGVVDHSNIIGKVTAVSRVSRSTTLGT